MKLIFEPPKEGQFFMSNLLLGFWCYHGVHIGQDCLAVSYNPVYKFWDIEIKRRTLVKSGEGRGTPEQQQKQWLSYIEELKEIHPQAKWVGEGWTWEHITDKTFIEEGATLSQKDTVISCPTVRFWIGCV